MRGFALMQSHEHIIVALTFQSICHIADCECVLNESWPLKWLTSTGKTPMGRGNMRTSS